MPISNARFQLLLCLQWATVAVFAGRAYQHLFWDAPFRTLLWDEEWMSGIVSSLWNMDWESYISSETTDHSITQAIKGVGLFYLCCALIALFIRGVPIMMRRVMYVGSLFLVILALLIWKEKFYSLGQFFEYSLQFAVPIFLYLCVKGVKIQGVYWNGLCVAMALTFICHGLYAIGYYPQPGNFMEMSIEILNVSDRLASRFLILMGILDFIAATAIFFPYTRSTALIYMIGWGFVTALARIWANFDLANIPLHLHQTAYEFVYRMPHFLVPLGAYLYLPAFPDKRLKRI